MKLLTLAILSSISSVFVVSSPCQIMVGLATPGPGTPNGGGGGSGIAIVGSPVACPPATAGTVTCSINTTGANGIYILATSASISTGSGVIVTDSATSCASPCNTYVQADVTFGMGIWYADNGTGSITANSGTIITMHNCPLCAWMVVAASGMKTSGSYDANMISHQGSSPSTTIQPGSINPGAGKHLVFNAYTSFTIAGTWTPDGAYTALIDIPFAGGTNYDGAWSYLIQTSGSATNPTATFNSSTVLTSMIASFGGA